MFPRDPQPMIPRLILEFAVVPKTNSGFMKVKAKAPALAPAMKLRRLIDGLVLNIGILFFVLILLNLLIIKYLGPIFF